MVGARTGSRVAVPLLALALVGVLAAALAIVATTPQPSQAAGHEHCFSDLEDDEVDGTGAATVEPRADILEVCASYEPTELTFSLRVADPTDPDTDPGWQNGDSYLVWAIQADAAAYGHPSGQVFLRVHQGDFTATATWFADDTPVCPGTGDFDGTWYSTTIDPGCLDVPTTITYSGFVQYDAAPGNPDPTTKAWDRAPEGMHEPEASGRFSGPLTLAGQTPPFARSAGRFAGPTRIDTAIAVSQAEFPQGAEEVYLARQDTFPDALAAGSTTRGPILLVHQCSLPQAVAFEIERLDPQRVIALGGQGAVCDAVLEQARDL